MALHIQTRVAKISVPIIMYVHFKKLQIFNGNDFMFITNTTHHDLYHWLLCLMEVQLKLRRRSSSSV